MVSQSDLLALRELFQSSKVLSTPQICSILGCSSRTAQKFFSELNCLRSYNKNAAYLTLPDIPSFNPSFPRIDFGMIERLLAYHGLIIKKESAPARPQSP